MEGGREAWEGRDATGRTTVGRRATTGWIWVQGGKAPDRGVKNLYLYVLIGCVCSRAWILYFDSYIRTECNYVVE